MKNSKLSDFNLETGIDALLDRLPLNYDETTLSRLSKLILFG